ncbi:hypothetical protein ScPMuIL_001405 [Solemya velum]
MADMYATRKQPVDEGYSWVILFGSFMMYIVVGGSVKCFGILYTEFLDVYGTGAGSTAWVGSLCVFMLFGLGPFANYLSRVYSFRKVCLLGGVVIFIGYLSTAFVQQMELMYLTFGIIAGGGYGLAYAPCSTLVNFYFEKRRAFANGIVVAASGTGAFLLPYLYRYVLDEYGLQGGILILSAVKMNTCVFAFLFRQPAALCKKDEAKIKEFKEVTLEKELQGTDIINDSRNNSNSLDPLVSTTEENCCTRCAVSCNSCMSNGPTFEWSLFKQPKFTVYTLGFFLAVSGFFSNFPMIPAHIESIGLSKQQAVFAMSIFGVCELCARVFFGWFADLKLIPEKYIFIISMFISGFAALIIPFFKQFAAIGVYCAILGVFPGSFFSLISILIVQSVGLEKLSAGFGIVSLCMGIGVGIAQPSVGWLEDATGNWDMSFRFAGMLKLLAGIVFLCEPLIVSFFREKPMPDEKHIPDGIELDIEIGAEIGAEIGSEIGLEIGAEIGEDK